MEVQPAPGKKYLVLPIDDQDPGMIFDVLAEVSEKIEAEAKGDIRAAPFLRNLRRLMAELGYYEEDVPGSNGSMIDIFHITAYVTGTDPRPEETETRPNQNSEGFDDSSSSSSL